MDRLESDECPQTCNKHFKVSFLQGSRCLMISYPSAAHKFVLDTVMGRLRCILGTIPAPASDLYCQVSPHSPGHRSESIDAAPDLMVKMWSRSCENPRRVPRTIWLMENACSQSDGDVMDKLRASVHDVLDLLVVCKILFKEGTPYHSPGSRGSTVKRLRLSERLSWPEWESNYGNPHEYARVVVDDYTWFSPSSVEFYVWIRKPGESKIDLDSLSGDGYAFGRLYPTVDLDEVDNAFRRGLELTKATMLGLDIPNMDLNGWLFPARVIHPERYVFALEDGAWWTAYQRYRKWYDNEKKSRDRSHRRQTARACASHEASAQLNSV
ncbi:hypothetical protein SCLCIDRAFT_1218843 [Scleroderma citrinum Foug A]|uniref:Uncharacterized protein n=1 Tax=Scleroderma citrinum Foug A TaxID=1036808 RepID=A0A0C3DQF7_9AGAM|nr:hypothetical protein SCLCIDRAFT_1218843 [Scleroderma citrinum Foug A]